MPSLQHLPRLGRHAGFAQFTELVAAPLHPSRGVPQGDPCSPLALGVGVALCPWNQLIEGLSNTLRTWCYMDDRTIAVVSRGNKALLQKRFK